MKVVQFILSFTNKSLAWLTDAVLHSKSVPTDDGSPSAQKFYISMFSGKLLARTKTSTISTLEYNFQELGPFTRRLPVGRRYSLGYYNCNNFTVDAVASYIGYTWFNNMGKGITMGSQVFASFDAGVREGIKQGLTNGYPVPLSAAWAGWAQATT
jgi:hypothetical protein